MDFLGPEKRFEYNKNWFRDNFEFNPDFMKTCESSTLGLEFQNPVQKLCVLFYPMLVKYNSIHQSVNENISYSIKATQIYIMFTGLKDKNDE